VRLRNRNKFIREDHAAEKKNDRKVQKKIKGKGLSSRERSEGIKGAWREKGDTPNLHLYLLKKGGTWEGVRNRSWKKIRAGKTVTKVKESTGILFVKRNFLENSKVNGGLRGV